MLRPTQRIECHYCNRLLLVHPSQGLAAHQKDADGRPICFDHPRHALVLVGQDEVSTIWRLRDLAATRE